MQIVVSDILFSYILLEFVFIIPWFCILLQINSDWLGAGSTQNVSYPNNVNMLKESHPQNVNFPSLLEPFLTNYDILNWKL